MVFNSLIFIVFLAIVLALHYAAFSWTTKKVNLLVASYLFYAAWNPPFIILLWLSTVVDFMMAKLMAREERVMQRKLYLVVSLVLNLGMLAYFKYGEFLLENFVMLMSGMGFDYQVAAPDIILPVGISFYTFCTLSYTIDVYRRDIPPEKSFLNFALFVTFFPHLVAGPILRPENLIPQFHTPRQGSREQFGWGIGLIILGLFMKVVVADNLLGPTADLVFGLPMPLQPLDAWAGVLAFSGQIFCDFAGYSTCAIGVAYCLGFTLVENFNFPYAAAGFSDFWRRWHISFSTWLRDYLYIPLGGNRMGSARTYINLMITMLLGGLWHGAAWTFVVWGGLHGTYLIVERLLTRGRTSTKSPLITDAIPVVVQSTWVPGLSAKNVRLVIGMLVTFFFINITWVFFRAPDFGSAGRLLASMFGLIPNGAAMLGTHDIVKVLTTIVVLVLIHWRMRDTKMEDWLTRRPVWQLTLLWTVMFIALILSQQTGDSFIYFQF